MAEATGLRNNALPYPVYAAPFGVVVPILDADGDLVTGATGLDSEVSKNGDTFADCTNEATEIATSSGFYYLLLTATEMTSDVVSVIVKTSSSGAKTTPVGLYPRKLVTLRSGTSQAGAAGTITLDASASAVDDAYNGCLIVATLDGAVEARIITDYVGSTKVASVTPNWNTTPDADDTFIVYLPEGVQVNQANVTHYGSVAGTFSSGRPEVNTTHAAGTAWGSGAITAASIASDAITAAKIAADAITAAKIADGAIDAATFAAGAINAAAIASDAITDAKVASDVTIASVTGAVGSVTGAVGSVTGAVGSVTGNVGGNVTGSVGSVATGGIAAASFAAGAINAAAIAADAITDAKVASDVTIASVTGAVGSVTGAVGSVTGAVGSVTGAVGSIGTGGIAAASFAAGAIDAAAIAADAIGASELAASAVTEIQSGLSTLDAAGVRTAVGLASANLDTQLTAIDDYLDTEVAAIKAKTDNLPSDPADQSAVEAAITAATSGLATQTSVNTIDDFLDTEIAAIKAKTDSLTFTGAGRVDANVAAVNNSTTGVDKLSAHLPAVLMVVVGSGSTTTSVVLNATTGINGAAPSAVNDFYNSRILIFTSGALAGQATSISDYVGSTVTLTVVALTSAPAAGVTAVIV